MNADSRRYSKPHPEVVPGIRLEFCNFLKWQNLNLPFDFFALRAPGQNSKV